MTAQLFGKETSELVPKCHDKIVRKKFEERNVLESVMEIYRERDQGLLQRSF